MIDNKIFDAIKMAKNLRNVIDEQKSVAIKALEGLEDGETKSMLRNLLDRASYGEVNLEQAIKEINEIKKNAS